VIAYLNGKLIEKRDSAVVIDVNGVGYDVFCPASIVQVLGSVGSDVRLYVHTSFSNNSGFSLYGFSSVAERALFLSLIKVDSVGPKSALNIMSAAPWDEIVHLIEDGDVAALSKLPKVGKKTAEHVVVKLKGKLGELFVMAQEAEGASPATGVGATAEAARGISSGARTRSAQIRKMRAEAQTALSSLGFKPQDVQATLDDLGDDAWAGDLQSVIRLALTGLAGNI
jgi:holliday junction DNA helicase RuvA